MSVSFHFTCRKGTIQKNTVWLGENSKAMQVQDYGYGHKYFIYREHESLPFKSSFSFFDSYENSSHSENSEKAKTVNAKLMKAFHPIRIGYLSVVTFSRFPASNHPLQKSL